MISPYAGLSGSPSISRSISRRVSADDYALDASQTSAQNLHIARSRSTSDVPYTQPFDLNLKKSLMEVVKE